jgi:hypothetical protein
MHLDLVFGAVVRFAIISKADYTRFIGTFNCRQNTDPLSIHFDHTNVAASDWMSYPRFW